MYTYSSPRNLIPERMREKRITHARIVRKSEGEKYHVRAYIGEQNNPSTRHPAGDYFTNDIDDAISTACAMVDWHAQWSTNKP